MEFEVILSEDFLVKSKRRRLLRNWPRLLVAFVLAGNGMALSVYSRSEVMNVLFIFGATLIGMTTLIYLMAWIKIGFSVRTEFKKLKSMTYHYQLFEETLEVTMATGNFVLKWQAFKELRIDAFQTQLEFSRGQGTVMPTQQIPPEALRFLIDRFNVHDKKVRDKRKKTVTHSDGVTSAK